MKRTTRFITLVLTLILALSCSMQIFAEEIQRLPSEPLCTHSTKFYMIQSWSEEVVDPNMLCRYVTYCYDAEWCVQCNEPFIIQETKTYQSERYVHKWKHGRDGKLYCEYCWRPQNP